MALSDLYLTARPQGPQTPQSSWMPRPLLEFISVHPVSICALFHAGFSHVHSIAFTSLPPELISNILKACEEDEVDDSLAELTSRRLEPLPLRFRRVSKSLRSLVDSTASLWTTITDAILFSYSATTLFLEKSQSRPLNIALFLSSYSVYLSGDPTFFANLRLAARHSTRWESFALFDSDGHDLHEVLMILQYTVTPMLHTIIASSFLSRKIRLVETPAFPRGTPALRTMIMRGCLTLPGTLRNVTTFEIDDRLEISVPRPHEQLIMLRPYGHLCDILGQLSSVQTLSLSVVNMFGYYRDPASALVMKLPSLRHLVLKCPPSLMYDHVGELNIALCDTLLTPSVERLEIGNLVHRWAIYPLVDFICTHPHKFENILSLSWASGFQSREHIDGFVAAFQSVEDLILGGSSTSDSILTALGADHWPALRRLTVRWSSFHVLHEFVKNRKNGGKALEYLTIGESAHFPDHKLVALEKLVGHVSEEYIA